MRNICNKYNEWDSKFKNESKFAMAESAFCVILALAIWYFDSKDHRPIDFYPIFLVFSFHYFMHILLQLSLRPLNEEKKQMLLLINI